MQRLLIDHLKRKKWYILGFGGYFLTTYCFLFLMARDRVRGGDLWMLNAMFLGVVLFGSIIQAADMRLSVSRIARTLPLSAREVAVASWLTFVAPGSLTVAIVLALTLCVSFSFGKTSGADFQLVPLALAWSAATFGTFYLCLCLMRFRRLFILLSFGLAALAVFYGPPIRLPWTLLQVPHVLTLLLGLTLSGVAFLLASLGRNLMIGPPQLSMSQLRGARLNGAGGGSMPPVLPSRRVGMARPWLQAFGSSCLGVLVVILLLVGTEWRFGWLSRRAVFLSERELAVRYGIIVTLLSVFFASPAYASWILSLRAFRALPVSTSRLALLLMGFPVVGWLPFLLVALPFVIIFRAEGTVLMLLVLLIGVGCASLFCALGFRLSIPPQLFGIVSNAVPFTTFMFWVVGGARSNLPSTPRVNIEIGETTILIKASLFLAALVLMGIAFFLFRQTIASGSRPYRPVPMIAERMPGGR